MINLGDKLYQIAEAEKRKSIAEALSTCDHEYHKLLGKITKAILEGDPT